MKDTSGGHSSIQVAKNLLTITMDELGEYEPVPVESLILPESAPELKSSMTTSKVRSVQHHAQKFKKSCTVQLIKTIRSILSRQWLACHGCVRT